MRMRRNSWSAYASILGLTGGSLAFLTACSDQAASVGGEDIDEISEGVIIGSNDLQSVNAGGANIPAKYRPYVNAFGRLTTSQAATKGFCTATHIGNGIGVSAGHCWSAGATRQNNISCTGGTTCNGHYVQWGNTSGGTASTSKITQIRAMQVLSGTNRLDYAFFEVSPVPPDVMPIDWTAKAPAS